MEIFFYLELIFKNLPHQPHYLFAIGLVKSPLGYKPSVKKQIVEEGSMKSNRHLQNRSLEKGLLIYRLPQR